MTYKVRPKGQGGVMGSLGRGNRHVKARDSERIWFIQELRTTYDGQKTETMGRGSHGNKRTWLKDLVCSKAFVRMS